MLNFYRLGHDIFETILFKAAISYFGIQKRPPSNYSLESVIFLSQPPEGFTNFDGLGLVVMLPVYLREKNMHFPITFFIPSGVDPISITMF